MFGSISALAANRFDAIDNDRTSKIALVIGNSHYKNIETLRNPSNDAELVAKQLKKLGFKVILGRDTSFDSMKNLLRDFARQINKDSIALFYYAGHGIQHQGSNYLIPIDADIKKAYEIEYFSVDLNMIVSALDEASPLLSVAFVDACRNNPFKKRGLFRNGLNQHAGGLAAVNSRAGSILSFATEPGNTAVDGTGKHSPYSMALAKKLVEPGLTVQEMLNAVGLAVLNATDGKQKPWYSSSPVAKFCFAGCNGLTHSTSVADALQSAIQEANIGKVKQLAVINRQQETMLNALFKNYISFKTQSLSTSKSANNTSKVTIHITEAVNRFGNRVIPSEQWAFVEFSLQSKLP